jgi:biotin carboxylase
MLLRAADRLGYPLALKIARSSGSRGVYCVSDKTQLLPYFELARGYQSQGALLIEEWLDGPEISVEGLCFGGKTHIVQLTDKCVFPGSFPVESGHTQPSRLRGEDCEAIRDCAVSGVEALGLENCAFHAELKVTSSGPKLIEIGARLGGDRISTHLTPLSTGVNLIRAAVEIALGRTPDVKPELFRGAAVRYFTAGGHGVLQSIEGIQEVAAMEGLELLFPVSERDGPIREGFRISPIRSSLDRYGHVVFSGETACEAARRADSAVRSLRFTFVPQSTPEQEVYHS